MRQKSINLLDLLANTTANMTLQELTKFRGALAEVLPVAIRQAADLAKTPPAQPAPAAKIKAPAQDKTATNGN